MDKLEIEKSVMKDTLKRIQHSLNCRFERDAELFIDNQTIQELKSMINNNQWQGIHDGMFNLKRVSPEILTIEIIKNAWLIKDIDKHDCKYLLNIFEACNKEIFLEHAVKIIDNKIYAPRVIKDIINQIYYMNIDVELCKDIVKSDNYKIYNKEILKSCMIKILDECENPKQLRYRIDKYITEISILNNSNLLVDYVKRMSTIKDELWMKEFASEVFYNYIEYNEYNKESIWFKIFRGLNKHTFDLCAEYLSDFGDIDTDSSIKIVRNYMAYQVKKDNINREYYKIKWIDLFKNKPKIRTALIIGLKNIYDESIKKEIANEMINSNGIVEHEVKLIKDILNEESTVFKNIDEVLFELSNLNKKNEEGHINNINTRISKSPNKEIILESLSKYLENTNVQRLYISMIKHSKNKSREEFGKVIYDLGEYIQETNCVVYSKLKEIIIANPSNFKIKEATDFLTKYDFEFYKQVFGNK